MTSTFVNPSSVVSTRIFWFSLLLLDFTIQSVILPQGSKETQFTGIPLDTIYGLTASGQAVNCNYLSMIIFRLCLPQFMVQSVHIRYQRFMAALLHHLSLIEYKDFIAEAAA